MRYFLTVCACLMIAVSLVVPAFADEVDDTINGLHDEIYNLSTENENLREDNDSLSTSLADVESENEDLKDRISELESELSSSQDETSALREDNESLTSSVNDLKLQVAQAESTSSSGSVVVSANDPDERAEGLAGIVESLIGPYQPRTQTETVTENDGTSTESVVIVPGVAGVDWSWIAAALLFTIVIYGIFRIIGGVLSWS